MKLPKVTLVDNWRNWHRMASMRMLAFASTVIGFLIANPSFLFAPIMYMPEGKRVSLAIGATVLIFFLVGSTRLLRKADDHAPDEPDAPTE